MPAWSFPTSEETPNTTGEELGPVTPPSELAVLSLNGGAPGGAAASMRDQLINAGYTNQLEPGDTDPDQTGNTVMCRAGLEREAEALAGAVGGGATVVDFPDPAPTGSDDADCVVIVGATPA